MNSKNNQQAEQIISKICIVHNLKYNQVREWVDYIQLTTINDYLQSARYVDRNIEGYINGRK